LANRVAIFIDSSIVSFSLDMRLRIVDAHGTEVFCHPFTDNRQSGRDIDSGLVSEITPKFTGGRDGRVAEGGGLLNRYTVKSRIGGSNPPLSAIPQKNTQNA
jgi:hypothetical protein